MKIPTIIRCFRVEAQQPIIRSFNIFYVITIMIIMLVYLINTNITIDYFWNKEKDSLIGESYVIKRDFEWQIDIQLRILNMSKQFYDVIQHNTNTSFVLCDGNKAICSQGSHQLEVSVGAMYSMIAITYKKMYDNDNTLMFYIDCNVSSYIVITFESQQLKNLFHQINMTQVMQNFKAHMNHDLDFQYIFRKQNYFAKCLKLQGTKYSCMLINHHILSLQTNRLYFILFNDQIIYGNTNSNALNIGEFIKSYVDRLYTSYYIIFSNRDFVKSECLSDYQTFQQNGLFQCAYSKTKLWSFPLIFQQLYIILPNLHYKQLSYHRQQYLTSNIKMLILPNFEQCYGKSKHQMEKMKHKVELIGRNSIYFFIISISIFLLNRIFVKYAIAKKIEKIGRKQQNQNQLIPNLPSQLQPIAKTIEKYQWVLHYSKSQNHDYQKILQQGLKVFCTEQSQYISIVRYIYNTLIFISENNFRYIHAAKLYEKLCDLEMDELLKQDQRINATQINKIYQLQLNRIQCYYKYAQLQIQQQRQNETKSGEVKKLQMQLTIDELFQRLSEYKDHLQIDQKLTQRGVILKVKLKYIYGINNSFQLLQQLQNSNCQNSILNQVRYIYALQLHKNKPLFDTQAIQKLITALKTKTTSEYKRKCLMLIVQILNDYPIQFSVLQTQMNRICSFYNNKKKALFIRRQTYQRNYQKSYDTFIKQLHEILGKNLIEQKNLAHQLDFADNLYDSKLTSNNNMSYISSSYSFMRDLKNIAQSSRQESKFVVVYRNDLMGSQKDKQKQKQRDQKRQFLGALQSVGTYLHIILIGVNLKESINKNKLLRLLKQKNSLIYIDLNEYDLNLVKEQLRAFME